MNTNVLSHKDIRRAWHKIDAKGKVLGRLATEVATLLMGKHKAQYVPYLDTGDFVVVVNAKEVKVTGKKESQKTYFRHSGYPSGVRVQTLAEVRNSKPEEIIKHAIKGMVPKAKLGKVMMKKLHIFAGNEHNFKQQLKEVQSA